MAVIILVTTPTHVLPQKQEPPRPLPDWMAEALAGRPEEAVEIERPARGRHDSMRPADAAPTLDDPSITADDDLALADATSVFKNAQLFLWDDPVALNLGLGREALGSNTTGSSNTALGTQALFANTVGVRNTAVGAYAMRSNIGENDNTAVGYKALYASYDGGFNTAIGAHALESSLYVDFNTAVGSHALSANLFGSENTAVGSYALASNTYGDGNTALGNSSLINNLTGDFNTAVGHAAMIVNDASHNTAVGFSALELNDSGQFNTAVGSEALESNSVGVANTAVGRLALSTSFDGIGNTALGSSAMLANERGSHNAAVGNAALFNNRTGDRNVGIGYRAGFNPLGSDDGIFILNEGETLDNGVIRVGTQGTQVATYMAGIYSTALGGLTEHQVCVDDAGQLGECTAMKSSRRFKDGIEEMGDTSEKLHRLRPVTFTYRAEAGGDTEATQYGLVAEEVLEVFPELVRIDAEGRPHAVRYQALISLLVNELQRQRARIDQLETNLERLSVSTPPSSGP